MIPQNRWAPGTKPEFDTAGWVHFYGHTLPWYRANSHRRMWPTCGLINRLETFGDLTRFRGWEAPRHGNGEAEILSIGWDDGSIVAITYDQPPQWIIPPDITYMGDATVVV